MTLRARTTGVDATQDLAAAVAALAQAGDVLLLSGELGAGKTAFTQGLGRSLGITEPITSPTFTLAREYHEGRLVLHHLDVYRLERFGEVDDVGIPELVDGGGILVIEWGDAVAASIPADYLQVRFAYGAADDDRDIEFHPVGSRWSARERVLAENLAPWLTGADPC